MQSKRRQEDNDAAKSKELEGKIKRAEARRSRGVFYMTASGLLSGRESWRERMAAREPRQKADDLGRRAAPATRRRGKVHEGGSIERERASCLCGQPESPRILTRPRRVQAGTALAPCVRHPIWAADRTSPFPAWHVPLRPPRGPSPDAPGAHLRSQVHGCLLWPYSPLTPTPFAARSRPSAYPHRSLWTSPAQVSSLRPSPAPFPMANSVHGHGPASHPVQSTLLRSHRRRYTRAESAASHRRFDERALQTATDSISTHQRQSAGFTRINASSQGLFIASCQIVTRQHQRASEP